MKRFALVLFIYCSISAFSQNLIDNSWLFSIGDSMAWKEINHDTRHWKTIKSGIIWEVQGYAGYDGFAWYRKKVVIPTILKEEIKKKGYITLNLGTIDDADEVYFNGKLLGKTGSLPPNYDGAYDKIRKWNIRWEDIRWDKDNLIAVRVYDAGGGGGITGANVSLMIEGKGPDFNMSVKFSSSDRVFRNDSNLNFSVNYKNQSTKLMKGKSDFYILKDTRDTVRKWSKIVTIPQSKEIIQQFANPKLEPGFYSLHIEFKSLTNNLNQSYYFGIEPEKISSPTDRPANFDNYWVRAKKELAAVDPQYKLIKQDSLCTDKRDVYLVEMRSLENVLIRGWYARPKAEGKYPAILHLQGYSTNQEMSWGYNGSDMAVFVLNIRGHGNSKDNINLGFPGFLQYNIKDREKYIYRGAYMDCSRALDFLFSRAEVDTQYVVVKGGSQGGALSFATAALNNERVSLCIPSVPFLSDFRDYFRIATWPVNEFETYIKSNPDFSMEGVYQTLRYFDIKNLAPWVKCPVLMSVGLMDATCPPHINFAAYNQLNVPKSYKVYPEAGHALPSEAGKAEDAWMKKQLNDLRQKVAK